MEDIRIDQIFQNKQPTTKVKMKTNTDQWTGQQLVSSPEYKGDPGIFSVIWKQNTADDNERTLQVSQHDKASDLNLTVKDTKKIIAPSDSGDVIIEDRKLSAAKRKHDSRESLRPNQSNTLTLKKKSVLSIFAEFNAGHNSEKDIILDAQEITCEDIRADKLLESCLNHIDSGCFGAVFNMRTERGKNVAVKDICRKERNPVSSNEVQLPLALAGEGIVRILAMKCYLDRLWIVMENAGRSIKWWLTNKKDGAFRTWCESPDNLINVSTQLLKVLARLERQRVLHRDIKTENVCLSLRDGKFVLTLIDFGSAQAVQDEAVFSGHTPEFLTPLLNSMIYELKTRRNFTLEQHTFELEKCDVWGAAIVILTIFNNGFHPIPLVNKYSRDTQEQERLKVMKMIMSMEEGFFEPLLREVRGPLQTVLRNILLLDRSKAWTARAACDYLDGSRPSESKVQKRCESLPAESELKFPKATRFTEHQGAPKEQVVFRPQRQGNPFASKLDFSALRVQPNQNLLNPEFAKLIVAGPGPSSQVSSSNSGNGGQGFVGMNGCPCTHQPFQQTPGYQTKKAGSTLTSPGMSKNNGCKNTSAPSIVGIGSNPNMTAPRRTIGGLEFRDNGAARYNRGGAASFNQSLVKQDTSTDTQEKNSVNIPKIIFEDSGESTPKAGGARKMVGAQPDSDDDYHLRPCIDKAEALKELRKVDADWMECSEGNQVPCFDLILPRKIATGRRKSSSSK